MQAQPVISSNQCGQRREEGGGCKKDGMERLYLNERGSALIPV